MESRVVTCVYCGYSCPHDAPTWNSEILTAHIKVCLKHPMRKAEADIALLRRALIGLVGAETKAELEEMELAIRLCPAPKANQALGINAIHALLATMPENNPPSTH